LKKIIKKGFEKLTAEKLFAKPSFQHWRMRLLSVMLVIAIIWLGLAYQIDELVVASFALVIAVISGAFAWGVGVVGLVPIIGPLVIKILSIPLIWLINGIGYLISFIAIKRGYSKDVLTYRGLTITLIIGIVIGFIIGTLLK